MNKMPKLMPSLVAGAAIEPDPVTGSVAAYSSSCLMRLASVMHSSSWEMSCVIATASKETAAAMFRMACTALMPSAALLHMTSHHKLRVLREVWKRLTYVRPPHEPHLPRSTKDLRGRTRARRVAAS